MFKYSIDKKTKKISARNFTGAKNIELIYLNDKIMIVKIKSYSQYVSSADGRVFQPTHYSINKISKIQNLPNEIIITTEGFPEEVNVKNLENYTDKVISDIESKYPEIDPLSLIPKRDLEIYLKLKEKDELEGN